MKKSIRILGIALLGVAALVLPLSAHATCGAGAGGIFGSYYSQITGTTNGPSLRSSFWMLGNGTPAVGPGIDNGALAETGPWVHPYGEMPIALIGKWDDIGSDGCPDTLTPTAAMAWAMSDLDGSGNMLYAVGCSARNGQNFTQWDMTSPPGCTSGCAPLALVPAPKATIQGTARPAPPQAQITVASPNFAPGFYGDGSAGCAVGLVIPQYEVYKQEVLRNATAPTSRDATAWVSVGTFPIGAPAVFSTTCAGDCDVYVSVLPAYDSGFKTGEPATGAADRVGANSTKVQAGPILANPPKPRISNPKKTQ